MLINIQFRVFAHRLAILPVIALLFLFPVSTAARTDSPDAVSKKASKTRIEREKRFLFRNADELNRMLSYVNETSALLISQVEAADSQSDSNTNEREDLLDWYQKYAEWLSKMSDELELDISNFFSHEEAGPERIPLYQEFARGCRKLAAEMDETVRELEGKTEKIEARMQKLQTAILERRVLVDKDDLELARELWPTYRVSYNSKEAVYKELTDDEVRRLRGELVPLEEKQKYFESLSELGKYEEDWLDLKAREFEKMREIVEVIGGADMRATAYAFRSAIRTYETDMAVSGRRSAEVDAKNHHITRSGTLKMLDRMEELSRYYDNMKHRYDSHIDWLKGQVGSFRADLVEIDKEL